MNSLGDFLAVLQDHGELLRIPAPVDSALEIAEITRRIASDPNGGPALFFESVRGSKIPVVTNLLGSQSRICRALGARHFEELEKRLKAVPSAEGPSRWLDALRLTPAGNTLAPRIVKTGYCQQVVKLGRDVNLWELPILRSWPDEQFPAITLGQVFTRCPVTQRIAMEMLPVQVLDQQRVTPCWHRQHTGHRHWRSASELKQPLPLAIVLGGHPAASLASLAPLPSSIDPLAFSCWLQGGKLELIKCRSHDLEVPATAEIVLEGAIDPSTPVQPASPFASPTGFYAHRQEDLPIVQITAVTHRANPAYPAQVFSPPPSEDGWMRLAIERLLLPWIQQTTPELVDYHSPLTSAGNRWMFVSIIKDYPHAARKVLSALWGHAALMYLKGIVIVDRNVNVHSADEVWFQVGAHVDPGRDLVVMDGPTDYDDHATAIPGLGRKLGIDATTKLPEERIGRHQPQMLVMPDDLRQQVTDRWPELQLPTSNAVRSQGERVS